MKTFTRHSHINWCLNLTHENRLTNLAWQCHHQFVRETRCYWQSKTLGGCSRQWTPLSYYFIKRGKKLNSAHYNLQLSQYVIAWSFRENKRTIYLSFHVTQKSNANSSANREACRLPCIEYFATWAQVE